MFSRGVVSGIYLDDAASDAEARWTLESRRATRIFATSGSECLVTPAVWQAMMIGPHPAVRRGSSAGIAGWFSTPTNARSSVHVPVTLPARSFVKPVRKA